MNKQEQQEAYIVRHFKRAPSALYDIGVGPKSEAHTLKRYFPKMECYGVEPLVSEFSSVVRFPGKIREAAIAEKPGMVTVHYSSVDMLNGSLTKHPSHDCMKIVDAITLDDFDAECKRPHGILLWMDIEGAELAALKGGAKLLQSHRVRWINLEERREKVDGYCGAEEIFNLLTGYGYYRICEYNKHAGHQDVLYIYGPERKR